SFNSGIPLTKSIHWLIHRTRSLPTKNSMRISQTRPSISFRVSSSSVDSSFGRSPFSIRLARELCTSLPGPDWSENGCRIRGGNSHFRLPNAPESTLPRTDGPVIRFYFPYRRSAPNHEASKLFYTLRQQNRSGNRVISP